MNIKAAVTYKKGVFTFDDKIKLEDNLKPDQVLVKIVATGVCHTDSCALNEEIPYPIPGILGHEGAGIVEKIGSNVQNLNIGDHVVLSYSSCNSCDNCKTAHPSLCENMDKLNFGGLLKDGSTPLSPSAAVHGVPQLPHGTHRGCRETEARCGSRCREHLPRLLAAGAAGR